MKPYYAFLYRYLVQKPLVLLLLLCNLTTTAQSVRYVSATGTNSNPASATSWATSTTNLQGAINASSANDQVWVRGGLYKPTSTTGPASRTISFAMKAGVAIYGGFSGTEITLSQRPAVNLTTPGSGLGGASQPSSTTLSGELGNPNSNFDNSNHVISNPTGLTTTAILDGFVITRGGSTFGTFPDDVGGGIYNNGSGTGNFCSPTIRNCLFQANGATSGGAMYNDGSAGGISSPSLTNCLFQANKADDDGGAMYNNGRSGGISSPSLTNCLFQANRGDASGGAMYNVGTSGGISSPSLTNCLFQANIAYFSGGAIINGGGSGGISSPSLTNCLFQTNSAGSGGAMSNSGDSGGISSPTIRNCSFQANNANFGGAIDNHGADGGTSSPSLTNCSFQANTARSNGGAMYNDGRSYSTNGSNGTSRPVLTNCILFNNGDYNTFVSIVASVSARYSLFDTMSGYINITGNLITYTSPFASTTSTGTSAAQLAVGSQAINAGDPATTLAMVGSSDLAGNNRIMGGRIDMGAYEFCYDATRLYVRAGASGTSTGLSWTDAFPDLQSAVMYGCSGSLTEIWVANGVYKPTSTTGPASRTISFSMRPNVAIYGGFVGTETTLSQRPTVNLTTLTSTTLSGDIGTVGNNTDNSYHVISNPTGLTTGTPDRTSILDGFVITGGNANGPFPDSFGGGMYNNGRGSGNVCSPTIRNCLFQANTASSGGAMYNDGYFLGTSSPSLTNCLFQANEATYGGAMLNDGQFGISSPSLTNCLFQANTALSGGAVYNYGAFGISSPSLTNCLFQANLATYGGAMYNDASSGISSPSLTNCSFQANTASTSGGAMYSYGAFGTSSPSLTNCVLFGNGGGNTFVNISATIPARYSLFDPSSVTVTGYTSVTGNLTTTTSPFVSTTSTRLRAGSPAINAGDPATTTAVVGTTDLAGNIRFVGGGIDMGAVEVQNEIFTISTGNWNNPAIWNVNRVPQLGDRARLKHAVTIPASYLAFVTALLYDPVSRLVYGAGGRLTLEP